jgi:hypothetical protein
MLMICAPPPFRCLTKKAVMSISSSVIDFGAGGVTLGESASRTLTITNNGALDVEYRIGGNTELIDSHPGFGTTSNLGCGGGGVGGTQAGCTGMMSSASKLSSESDGVPSLVAGCFATSPSAGVVAGYSSVTVSIRFCPVEARQEVLDLIVTYR